MQEDNESFLFDYEQLANEGKYADAVISLVEDRMTITFVEIDNLLSSYIETKGSMHISIPDHENLILWAGMSEPFVEIMYEVFRSKKVETVPTQPLTYMFDGNALNMPIASSARPYKTPHWVPVVFNPRKEEHKSVTPKKRSGPKKK